MNKEVIGLIVGTIVIFLSFVFVCGTFLFLYLRDQKLVRLAKSSVQGTVIGYSRFREGYPPIVEYTVDGISYKKTLQYFMFKTVTIPWGTTKFLKDYTREDMLAPSITRYSNSFVSFKRLMQSVRFSVMIISITRSTLDFTAVNCVTISAQSRSSSIIF